MFVDVLWNVLAVIGIVLVGGFVVFFIGNLLLAVIDPKNNSMSVKSAKEIKEERQSIVYTETQKLPEIEEIKDQTFLQEEKTEEVTTETLADWDKKKAEEEKRMLEKDLNNSYTQETTKEEEINLDDIFFNDDVAEEKAEESKQESEDEDIDSLINKILNEDNAGEQPVAEEKVESEDSHRLSAIEEQLTELRELLKAQKEAEERKEQERLEAEKAKEEAKIDEELDSLDEETIDDVDDISFGDELDEDEPEIEVVVEGAKSSTSENVDTSAIALYRNAVLEQSKVEKLKSIMEEQRADFERRLAQMQEENQRKLEEIEKANQERLSKLEEESAKRKEQQETNKEVKSEPTIITETTTIFESPNPEIIAEYEQRLFELQERLKANEKSLKTTKKEYIPLRKVKKSLENDQRKLRRKEALVAKQKVVLYGVNNYVDIDDEKAKKLAEDLDLLDGLRLSVQHCEEVMEANKERYPILENTYNLLSATNQEIKDDIKEVEEVLEKLKKYTEQ